MKLHDYQLAGVRHLVRNRYAALLWDPGMGKTLTTLAAFRDIRGTRVPAELPLLIIAPLSVAKAVWQDEVAKWFPDMTVRLLHGRLKQDNLRQGADIFVINPEGLPWLYQQDVEFAGLVIDELTKFKATNTKRFRELRKRLKRFRFRWGLTGTPAPNSMMELFGQVMVLDGGERLGPYIGRFRNRYFQQAGPYEWVLRQGSADAIRDKVRDILFHLDAKDFLDVPDRTDNVVLVNMPSTAQRFSTELEKELYVQFGDGELTVAHAATLVNKLQQIAQGFVYLDDGSVIDQHTAKLDRLEDLAEEVGGPLFVVYKFKEDLRRLQERFPHAVDLRGDVQGIVRQWNAGELQMVLAQPQSAGHGLNMQAGGHTVCWYALNHSLEQYIQANGRIHRQGQEHPVVVHHLVARGTVDEDIMEVLRARDSAQNALLEGLRRRIERVLH